MAKNAKPIVVPKLVNGRGTLPINRTYPGVGQIRVASGTTDPATYIKVVQTLDDLANVGNLTTLASIKNGQLGPLEAHHSLKQKGINTVLVGNLDRPLRKTVEDWLEHHSIKANTKRGYKSHLAGFFKTLTATHAVRDIPVRLEAYRKKCAKAGTARSFNQLRAVLLAFAKAEFKKTSQLYRDIHEIEPLAQQQKLKNDAVGWAQIAEFVKPMATAYQDIIWSLCYSGMRIGEYYEESGTRWEVQENRLIIHKDEPGWGNKGYSRIVTLPFPLHKPTRSTVAFRRALRTRAKEYVGNGGTITPHTFRKCFVYWCSEAGINRSRIRAYVGHGIQSITDIYEKHEVDSHLDGDAKTLREFVERVKRGPQKPKSEEQVKRDAERERRAHEGATLMNAIRHGTVKLVGDMGGLPNIRASKERGESTT